MSVKRKFGAFSGVFTPSILTILGVIMYMRLGWVVGQAGLITALGIIFLAHVISISTGLSISSIATDKKIKTGGIYYMLSRSLGLPMGGSIGITLFAGTALSIALYIIGFCESFLGIGMIRDITGLGTSIDDIRIMGSIILILLVVIAFASTSIAIKAQFFILGAIALSLASIGIGIFTGEATTNENISWLPIANGVSLTVVFAIFFPAVTGFTAGVAMSGDLKNPQKNIPLGTMLAIVAGLIVYVTLALIFGLLVDRELLLTDNNFLLKIAWSAPLVVAGIWGATLSSALGGILGGPRILQAMSRDRITPKIFGKGYGINNEPRNALLLTFLIAEIGILIGELDVIAAIVAMFYIAAYGFINLAFALEKWASADFRPSFKISKWIGIIGFAACFGVMFKLDTPVMFLAMIIMAGIYFYIRRRKLELDFGDVWVSVWSSIARAILHRIDRRGLEARNWRPNIILFSGGSKSRPHLIQFGKDLVGNQGFLSNFDLILNTSSNVLFKKHQQSVDDQSTRENEGIFTRKQECKNIYEGIEAISSTYGFSGVEPNTLLLGWARQSEDPVRFAKMIKSLGELDLNILMMDYDKDVGFGKREIIDVWCRGGGNNCHLVLSLVKFMWLSETWKNARIRILIINPYNDDKEMLIEDIEGVLEQVRMDAEIKIINNQIEKRPVDELIQVESSNSDIVFLGIPNILEGQEEQYVNQVNRLCHNVGTVVLVKASSYFKDLEIGRSKGKNKQERADYSKGEVDLVISRRLKVPEITYPDDPACASELKNIFDAVKCMNEEVFSKQIVDLFSLNRTVYAQIVATANESFYDLNNSLIDIKSQSQWKNTIGKTYRIIFANITEILEQQENVTFKDQGEILQQTIVFMRERCESIIEQSPEIIYKEIRRTDLLIRKGDPWSTVGYKLRKQLLFGSFGGVKKQKVRFRRLVASYFEQRIYAALTEVMQNWGMISLQQVIKTQELNNKVFDTYFLLNKVAADKDTAAMINEKAQLNQEFRLQIDKLNEASLQTFYTLLMNKTFYLVRQISKDLQSADIINKIRVSEKQSDAIENKAIAFSGIPTLWLKNQKLLSNFTRLELILFVFITHAKDVFQQYYLSLQSLINDEYTSQLKNIEAASSHSTQIYLQTLTDVHDRMDIDSFRKAWIEKSAEYIGQLDIFSKEIAPKIELLDRSVFDNFKEEQFKENKGVSLRARKLLEHILKEEFTKPIQTLSSETLEWYTAEINKNKDLISEAITVCSLLKSDKSISNQMPQLNKYVVSLSLALQNADKNKTRMLNQVQERINALMDKFSLNAITRRSGFLRKFLR